MFFFRIRFAVYVYGSLILLFNCLFLSVLLHLFPINANDNTAAGIEYLRRLQTGRTAPGSGVGPLACLPAVASVCRICLTVFLNRP